MYKHILVPTDGSKLSAKTAKQAVKLAKALGAKIAGFYASPEFGSTFYGDGYILRAPSAKVHAEATQKQARLCLSAIEVEAEVDAPLDDELSASTGEVQENTSADVA